MSRTQVDEVFEQCLAAMQTRGLTVEDCLQLYPALRGELEPLLSLAARLQTARSLRPRPEFQAAAARRLSKLAAARSAPPRRKTGFLRVRTGGWAQIRRRLSPLLVGVLVVILIASGFGTVAASAQSLPGDFLYPVKRAEETVHFALTLDEAGRAGLRLDYASRRVDEAVALVHENRTQAVKQVLADYNDQIQSELTFLQPGSPLTAAQQVALASRLLNEAQRQAGNLEFVNKVAPPTAQSTIETALSSSQQAYNQAAKILRDSGSNGSIQPTPSIEKPTLPAALTSGPTLSPTLQSSPTQRPSLSTPIPASAPSALPPQATQTSSGPVPTNNVARTPLSTPGTGNSATAAATLPLASNLPSPTGMKLTPRPTLSPTPQNSPTQKPTLSTPAPASAPPTVLPQVTQPNTSPLPTNSVVLPPPPTPGTSGSAPGVATLAPVNNLPTATSRPPANRLKP